jgi:hypothetical protein
MTSNRTFTTDEANRTLPLVIPITEDVVDAYRRLGELAQEYRAARGAEDRTAEGQARLNEAKQKMSALSDHIEACMAELSEIGCHLKDPQEGLIDFPAELDGEAILLCWKVGEERVEYWHNEIEGFAGRRPLPVTSATSG